MHTPTSTRAMSTQRSLVGLATSRDVHDSAQELLHHVSFGHSIGAVRCMQQHCRHMASVQGIGEGASVVRHERDIKSTAHTAFGLMALLII